jgi:(1->4)-alpha-D-glucan 1-alpha-D-glucosylmutase
MSVPASTYRLQIRESFALDAAAEITAYLHDLGIDWVYLSPLLRASAGSDHGYDVVDHSLVDPARGGNNALDRLANAAHDRGMGILIDIVPNHMGVANPRENSWWWDVLQNGRQSKWSEAFDIDWEFGGGKVRIPVLGGDVAEAIEREELRVVGEELHYFDSRYPLAPGSSDDDASLETILDRQHYELMNWRREDAELNYRRFFAVSSLAGIRVELPWVFEASHTEIVRWVRDGIADGLRVDHPDGLADPGGYLDALAAATGGTEVWVEKILEGDEKLPPYWATAGTTGYDALADLDRVLVDPAGKAALDALDSRLRGRAQPIDWGTLIHGTKRAIADGILRSEVLRLERELPDREIPDSELPDDELPDRELPDSELANRELPDSELPEPTDSAADAIAELLACFPVYRSYLPAGVEHLETAATLARKHRPELVDVIDALLPILSDPEQPAARRFQQTTGMVMAKGVEDTAFYRYTRLSSLTEVGADPEEFSIGVDEFHERQLARQAGYPASLTTLSTHDTKRGEDTRARISVLSEIPERWEATLGRLRELAPLDDGALENLLWESIVGAWPVSRERLHNYAEKAAREAGSSTRWTDPDLDFEKRMHATVDAAFDDPQVAAMLDAFVAQIAPAGWSNSLTLKLIQLTAPGVPDVYQGSELWETSLVDPDNRRPIDFDIRRLYLAAIDAGAHPPVDDTGTAKLLVTTRTLRLRRDHPELFTRYAPLPALGEAARHAVAFDRGGAIAVGTRLPVSLKDRGGWGDTVLMTPGHPFIDVISDRRFGGGSIPLADLLASYPVALLAPAR